MPSPDSPPQYDACGLNILDPKDRLGVKSEYITLIQEKALLHHLPVTKEKELAVDIGCGYGRLTDFLTHIGWHTIGIDPDPKLVAYARSAHSGTDFLTGALPELPISHGTARLLVIQNVLRPLLLMDKLDVVEGSGRYLAPGGHLLVVENVWPGKKNFINEDWLLETFRNEGLELIKRIPIRAGRWWLLYLIRYGIIPRRWLPSIANYELAIRSKEDGRSQWRYTNVLFLFQKPTTDQ
jgi:SAM-dependent methyltransferase